MKIKLSRDFTNKINWILDNIVPPVIRDSKFFMEPFFRVLFGEKRKYFMTFKDDASFMDNEGFVNTYSLLADSHIQRDTDLSDACIKKISQSIMGSKVLDIGCGRGTLVKILFQNLKIDITGIDIYISDELKQTPHIKFIEGNIEKIDFPDQSFDTVICSHTLEHVLNLQQAIKELRRVSKKRLIVVVPRQREYLYTFDLHLHFFPYASSVRKVMGKADAYLANIGNDFFYYEDFSSN
jgi:ubiquinone/menaquinone biosynthesis C-methylase UbiE